MTLKIGPDVQFIKTDTAERDFRRSRSMTVQKSQQKKRKKRLHFAELKYKIRNLVIPLCAGLWVKLIKTEDILMKNLY